MPRRALALLCLAACAAPESAASAPAQGSGRELEPAAAASPGPASNGPVPADSPPVPSDSPPRLLAADVARFGVLADGALLIEPRPTWPEIDGVATYTPPGGLVRVDPGTGARTPWDAPWTATGWKLGRGGAPARIGFEVSPDGRWVAIAYSFEIRRSPALTRPELVALVVARSDGSDPRCVGVGVPSDDPPPYTFSQAVHAGGAPLALNGLGLWVAMMVGLTVVNYGFPIAQIASLKEEFAAAQPKMEKFRHPGFLASFTEGMDVIFTLPAPILELDAQFERR